jgi:1-acyl-sn-glycerol-3-phosphate acyltransferase
MFLMHRRIFRDDSRVAVSGINPPLHILHQENIPQDGPCVITINHYTDSGFHIWWAAFAISSLIQPPVHWVIAGEWTAPGKWYEPIKSAVSRFASNRIARIYDFTTMPPMPPREKDIEERAASVRKVLEFARRARNPIIGLAPEGGDQPNGVLTMPASGSGRFALLLAAQGLRFMPVGVYESGGEFCLNFGESYELKIPHGLSADEKDSAAARIIMENIAPLLPENLRGIF